MQADRDFHGSGPQDCIWKIQPGTQNNPATSVFFEILSLDHLQIIVCFRQHAGINEDQS